MTLQHALSIAAGLTATAIASSSFAAAFTPGDLVVLQIGATGSSSAPTSAATPDFLQEFTTTGASVGSGLAIPTSPSGSNAALTDSGSATSDGQLSLSADKSTLVLTGYNTPAGTASVASGADARVVALINTTTGAVNTATALTDAYSANNIRSAYLLNATTLYTAGAEASGGSGVRLTTTGGTTSTAQQTDLANGRVVQLANSTLYVSSSSGTFDGISSISGGITTLLVNNNGSTKTTNPGLIPGVSTTGSAYDFLFSNPTTLYVTDDRSTLGGGIEKFSLVSGSWVYDYSTLAPNLAGTGSIGARSITTDGSKFYIITADGQLDAATDTGSAFTFTQLATSPANTNFRGVEFLPASTPAPEPASLTLLSLGTLLLLRRRNKK